MRKEFSGDQEEAGSTWRGGSGRGIFLVTGNHGSRSRCLRTYILLCRGKAFVSSLLLPSVPWRSTVLTKIDPNFRDDLRDGIEANRTHA